MTETSESEPKVPHFPEFLLPETERPAPVTETVTALRVSCMGDEARGLGHPRVWLAIIPEIGFVDCGYCDKRFVLDPKAHDAL